MRLFKNGAPASEGAILDLREGAGISLTIADEPNNAAASVTIANSGSSTANSVSLFGDSITDDNVQSDGSTYNSYADFGYFTWANILTSRRAHLLGVHGHRGYRTDQLVPLVTEPLADAPHYCIVLAGTNDILQGTYGPSTLTNLTFIWDTLKAAGITVIAGTVPPCGTALTTTQLQNLYTLNSWIRRQAYVRQNFYVVDWATPLADPATGQAQAGMLASDNIHPSSQGAYLMGNRLATLMSSLMPFVDMSSESSIDPNNLIPNGNMTGNVAGVATNWNFKNLASGTPTATPTKVARTDDVPGEWQQGVVSDTTGILLYYAVTTGFSVGDQVYMQMEFQTDAGITWNSPTTQGYLLRASIVAMTAGFATLYSVFDNNHITPNAFGNTYRPAAGVFRTPVLTVPATTARLQAQLQFGGQGTIRVGRVGLYKVGTGPAY